jgi:hypothetical protein
MDKEELIKMCLILTIKVVAMMDNDAAPFSNIATAMNWELPANTRMDMIPICHELKPAFWARIPKASPVGK